MMSLHEKFLSDFDFSETHSLIVHASAERTFSVLLNPDFSGSSIIKILCALRGMPSQSMKGIAGLQAMGFTLLEVAPEKEIILGLVGQFWKSSGNIQHVPPEMFTNHTEPGFCKATWNFYLNPINDEQTRVTTETRIRCYGADVKRTFGRYWFFIKPFSGIIRMQMLREIRKNSERQPS